MERQGTVVGFLIALLDEDESCGSRYGASVVAHVLSLGVCLDGLKILD